MTSASLDYQAFDLSGFTNAVDDLDAPHARTWHGLTFLRGLPFLFSREGVAPAIVRLAPGNHVAIPVEASSALVRSVTFAHRARGEASPMLAPVSRRDGVYAFQYEDGDEIEIPIRDGIEIAIPGQGWGDSFYALPSLAVPDQPDGLPDREIGGFADATARMTEVVGAGRWQDRRGRPGLPITWRYHLWSWINPAPERRLVGIELRSSEAVVEVGGICLGFVDEHPLRPERARVVFADIPADYTGAPSDLALEVDRGTVGYTSVVLRQGGAEDPFSTWGDPPNAPVAGVYARVASVDSGTVRLLADGEALTEARWKDVREGGVPGLRSTESGRNWVRTTVVDDETGEPIPCRVNFTSPDGVPYQPYGHQHHVASDLSGNQYLGPDVRLGRTTYAYVDGGCEGWLPRGRVRVRAARGFEYEAFDSTVAIDDDTRELTIRLRRRFDPTATGWYSGDTHVHMVSTFGGLKEAAAEGVSVVHLLQMQWGNLYTNPADFVGDPVASADGRTILFTSQENRQRILGHLNLLGLKRPIAPWSTDGPEEAEMGSGFESTLSNWADRGREQGSLVLLAHFPVPTVEPATLVASGRVDAIELKADPNFYGIGLDHYYRYLNAGYRVPLASGTDKLSHDVPIGRSRTYVRLDEGPELSFDAWCDALREGRSYTSSGPLLELSVEGAGIGETIRLPETGGTVAVQATARSIFPMFRLELVVSGQVVASAESASGARELRLDENVRIDRPGWVCVRVGGGGPDELTLTTLRRAILAHTSPVYVDCGDRPAGDLEALDVVRTLVERAREYVEDRLAVPDPGVVHHHGGDHGAYLLRPFDEARLDLDRRSILLGREGHRDRPRSSSS